MISKIYPLNISFHSQLLLVSISCLFFFFHGSQNIAGVALLWRCHRRVVRIVTASPSVGGLGGGG